VAENVDIPHDWSIHGNFTRDEFEFFTCLITSATGSVPAASHRLVPESFPVPVEDKGKGHDPCSSTASTRCSVYINGNTWASPYGYTSFCYDLTPHLNYGTTDVARGAREQLRIT